MTQPTQKVKVKLEIKGSPDFKFEYKGELEKAVDLTIDALNAFKKRVLHPYREE